MSLRGILGDIALASQTQGPGTYGSGALDRAGDAQIARVTLAISAITGTPSVTVKMQSAPDMDTWSDIPGSTSSALTAAGSISVNAVIPDEYVQAVVTITGSSSTATFAALVEVLPG